MAFPSTMTLVTVAIRFDTPPSGGATGDVVFTIPEPLNGPTDGSIIPPGPSRAELATDGTASIQLPATNDPDWTPTGWAYIVRATVNGLTRYGTLQLDYQTTSVQLADLIQWNGAAVAGTTYATLAQLTTHTAATTSVHGITDTAALVLTDDARLTNARTPTAHAASHENGGSDELALDGSQITAGTVAAARLPDLSATYLPLTGGTVTGNIGVQDAATPTKAYRFRTNGSNLDLEGTGSDIFLSVWSGTAFDGTQRNYARLESGADIAHALGRWLFAASAFAGSGVADLDPSTGVAAIGAKNGLSNIQFCGYQATAGAPSTGTWAAGDVVLDSAGAWQLCTAGGTPGTWVSGGAGTAPTFAGAQVTSGDLTTTNDAAFTLVPGLSMAIAAVAGDEVELSISGLFDMSNTTTEYFDVATVVSGAAVRYSSSGTATPATEGDPSLYPLTSARFVPRTFIWRITVGSGDLAGGNVAFQFAHKGGGSASVLASSSYPLRWRLRNDHQ